jgi:type IV pilus assembly protein PilA
MACALHWRSQVGLRIRRVNGSARTLQRGFTLIEMMVVVVIVGVLAMLAVVGYRKLVQSSHVTEATNMVQSIRLAQEAYHAETQQYANISSSLGSWYPQPSPNGRLISAWGGPCTGCKDQTSGWAPLPVHVDGPVLFGYATVGGASGDALPNLPSGFPITLVLPATDWFIVTASCDLDGDPTTNTNVLTTSWSNQVFTFNEGQ